MCICMCICVYICVCVCEGGCGEDALLPWGGGHCVFVWRRLLCVCVMEMAVVDNSERLRDAVQSKNGQWFADFAIKIIALTLLMKL